MTSLTEGFTKKMTASMGKIHQVSALDEVPKRVKQIAAEKGLEPRAVSAALPEFRDIDWKKFKVEYRRAEADDALGISLADFAIAETGTLVFAAAPEAPASLNFVPEYSIAVLREADILEKSEDLWAALENAGRLPHTLNLISGPSKTGDIEQTLFLGAHGPRELHVIIVAS